MEIKMNVKGVALKPIGEFENFQGNLKRITPQNLERLKRSIVTKGIISPIYIWADHNFILDGHQRITAIKSLISEGYTLSENKLPYLEVEAATEKEAAEMVLLFAARYGDITEIGITEFIERFNLNPYELDPVMNFEFKPVALPFTAEDVNPDEELPPMQTETSVKFGDIYELGDHRVMCGDSASAKNVDQLFENERPSLIITSPPYNVNIKYAKYSDNKSREEYFKLIEEVLRNCKQMLRAGCFICWNVGSSNQHTDPYEHANHLIAAGFELYREIIWQKTGIGKPIFQNSTKNPKVRNYKPNYMFEIIFMASNGTPVLGADCEMPEESSCDVWKINASTATIDLPTVASEIANPNYHGKMKKKAHPAVFPVKLPLLCIQTLTAKNEAVFDPFGGSGTTLIAAEKAHRHAYIMEIDPLYVQLILDRWALLTNQKAKLVSPPSEKTA